MKRALAASFVITFAASSAGCEDKPRYAPNPPATETPPTALDAGTVTKGDPVDPPTVPNDAGRRIIANPPRIMDAPDGGYLERRDDGCFWAEAKPQPCPPGADCKPSAPMRRVRCPEPKP
jgi:hypothetical protein